MVVVVVGGGSGSGGGGGWWWLAVLVADWNFRSKGSPSINSSMAAAQKSNPNTSTTTKSESRLKPETQTLVREAASDRRRPRHPMATARCLPALYGDLRCEAAVLLSLL